MFRIFGCLNSKSAAARIRLSNSAAVSTAVCDTPALKKQPSLVNISSTTFARVWPSFNTKALADALDLSLPPTANLVAIDSNSKKGNNNNDVASILRFMILHHEEVLKLRDGKDDSYPLVVVVKTSLNREDAETNDLVLSMALQQRKRFKDITAVVLDAKQSSAAMSVLKQHKYASQFGDKKPTAHVNVSVELTPQTTPAVAANDEGGNSDDKVKVQQHVAKKTSKVPSAAKTTTAEAEKAAERVAVAEKTVERVAGVEQEKSKCQNTVNVPQAKAPTTTTKTAAENKKEMPASKETKKNIVDKKSSGKSSASASHTSPPGEVKTRATPLINTHANARESLRQVFRSSLAAPFQLPTHVERALFSGYTDKLRVADLLNLPVYGGGEAFTLYYRLTGAGACRTPLVTITQIIKSECERRLGDEMKAVNDTTQSVNRVPVLLLLGASFLVSEDANIMCHEYQNALRKEMSLFADITVVVVPTCFTEKNVLFALKNANVKTVKGDDVCCKEEKNKIHKKSSVTGEGNVSPSTNPSRSTATPTAVTTENCEDVNSSAPTFSEDVLRSVVRNALEEVALLHEKSTEHLVSTLKKLVAYWSRERVIELMEGLQGERGVLLDTTKELGEAQQQLRDTKVLLKELQKQVKEVNDKIKECHYEEKETTLFEISKVVECVRDLEMRLVRPLSKVPSEEQITLNIREELVRLQTNLQCEMCKMLMKELKEAQEQQSRELQLALKEHTSENEKEKKITQQTLQELPQYIQTVVEKTLRSFSFNLSEQKREIVKEENEASVSPVNDMCDEKHKTVGN